MDFLLIATVCLILFGLYLKRNLRYHLLSLKLTGPTALPLLGNYIQLSNPRNALLKIFDFHRTYGLRFRGWLAYYFVFFTIDPRDIEVLFNSQMALEKSSLFYGTVTPLFGQSLLLAKVSKWRIHRKIIQPALTKTITDSFSNQIQEQSKIFVDRLKRIGFGGEKPKDMFHPMFGFLLELYGRNYLGLDVTNIQSYQDFSQNLYTLNTLAYERMSKPWLSSDLVYSMVADGRITKQASSALYNFVEHVTNKSNKGETGTQIETDDETNRMRRNSNVFRILKQSVESEQMTTKDLRDEMLLMIIGATETMATTLSFSCVILGSDPQLQNRILSEIFDVTNGRNQLDADDVPKLKYLERFLCEVMRLFPPVPQLSRETTDDIQLHDGTILPCGATFVTHVMRLHRCDEFWPDPLRFDPDRFLPDACAQRDPYTYIPFSIGPRNCIGMRYGMNVMKTTLAQFVLNFRIFSDVKSVADIPVVSHIFLYMDGGFPVQFVPRNPTI